MKITRLTTLAALGAVAALSLAGCAANEGPADTAGSGDSSLTGTIKATGATSQTAAQEAWTAGFQQAHSGVTINYEGTGSGTGRTNFQSGASAFIGSDRAFKDEEVAKGGFKACTSDDIVEVPLYISPVAISFHLDGVKSLKLDSNTIASIFAGKITKWNDPAIAATNAGVTLPDLAITPVHRSDDSGTTEVFVSYLKAVAPSVWTYETSGVWPIAGGEAGNGTSGVVQAIKAGNGTIGYADESQVKDMSVASIQVGSTFEAPTAEGASKLVEASPLVAGRAASDLVFDVDPSKAADGAYPIALVSYMIGCVNYADADSAAVVKAYFEYAASAEGQKAAQDNAGSAPISDALRTKVVAAIDAIKVG